jgi:tetratricopeptide (TPR) repeat protein
MAHRQAAWLALVLLVVLVSAADARGQDEASARALRRWVDAVVQHQPGSADASAAFTASLSFDQRLELNPAMELFVKGLRGDMRSSRDAAQRQIIDLCLALRRDPGADSFVRRAVILHTDSALFANRLPPPDESAAPPGRATRRPPSSPLLSIRRAVTEADGRILGRTRGDWNWPFARYLLETLMPSASSQVAPDRDFVAAWYHAADAYLMASGNLAEMRPQLQQASIVLADDPHVLFDRACYSEAFGLPSMQALRDDATLRYARDIEVGIPSEDSANAEAERLFRRVIAADAGYGEAHLRLARLLERQGRYEDAAAEIARALAAPADRQGSYLAHIVAGRIDAARRRPSEALAHYSAALALFADAQSALLGASEAALMTSDVNAAVSFAQRLGPRSRELSSDPWWSYRLGAGRDAAALIGGLWTRTR